MDQGQHRTQRVVIETEHHRITGLLTLARDGYRSRVSDLLNANERDFISLTAASVKRHDGGGEEEHPHLLVSRRHIVIAVDESEG